MPVMKFVPRDVASSNSLEPIPSSSPFEYFWENSSSAWRAALSPIVGPMIVSLSDGAVWIQQAYPRGQRQSIRKLDNSWSTLPSRVGDGCYGADGKRPKTGREPLR